jgi:hypothetical protein
MAKTPKTTTAPTGSIAPFGLRMLPELRAKVEASAKESGRSMNAEVVARLEASYKLEDAMDLVLDQAKQIKELRYLLMQSNFSMAHAFQVLSGTDDDRDGCLRALSDTLHHTAEEASGHFKHLLNEYLEREGISPEAFAKKIYEDRARAAAEKAKS